MGYDLIPFIGHATKATRKVFGLAKDFENTSGDVIFRRGDLTAVQTSLERLNSTFLAEQDYLDYATQTKLVNTLRGPVQNWQIVAERMSEFLQQFQSREAKGQYYRPNVIWRSHKHEIEQLRRKAEECKGSLLIAITAAAACVQSTHFRTLHRGLCGIQQTLQANHEESRGWMRELNGNVEKKHEESRSWVEASNRSRRRNHDEATMATREVGMATREVGQKLNDLIMVLVAAETAILAVIGVWWYFWWGSTEGKHEEARGWMQSSDRSRMVNHHESMAATREVGKKIDDLVTGLVITGAATLVAIAATGAWWYFWGREGNDTVKPKLKPKPMPKPKPKMETSTPSAVPAADRGTPIQAARAAPAATTAQPSTATKLAERDAANTTTRQEKDGAQKEEKFADVMSQLKIQLDKKARAGVVVGA